VTGRLYFRKRGPVSFNAQVVEHGSPLWCDAIALRDYLRAHPEERDRYAGDKRRRSPPGDTLLRYSEEKESAVRDLLERARRWAAAP